MGFVNGIGPVGNRNCSVGHPTICVHEYVRWSLDQMNEKCSVRSLSLALVFLLLTYSVSASGAPLQSAPPPQTAGDTKPTVPGQQSVPSVPSPPGAQPQTQTAIPLGTAAAPQTQIDGVTASTPSGAAIAPAKQKRVRKFSVRTALVVGAVVAVGAVAGASLATSSRP